MASLPAPVELTLTDDEGNAHSYMIARHPATEGGRVMCQILGLVTGPLARLIVSAFKAMEGGGTLGDVLSRDISDLDLDGVGQQVGAVLLSEASPKLIRELMRYVSRDGQRLSVDHAYNVAYTANYGELILALWEVVKANGFLPLSRIKALVDQATPTPSSSSSGG